MSKVDSAIPEAGKADAKQLAAIDADTLAQYVVDQTHPWWRRRPCVEALQGRVPEERVPGLLDRIRDPEDTSEVRIALLELLGDRIALLPYLVTVTSDERYGVYEQALHTRGRLGDLSAAPQLAELAASPWNHRARLAEAGLDLLLAQHGSAAVEKAVGSDTAAGRTFLDRIRAREHADLTPSLAHPDLGVARRAVELILSTGRPDNEHLLDHVVTGPTLDARLWAVYALHRRGRDVRDLWAALDRPRVELPALPEDVRTAIVNTYPSETYCDPRWLVERACLTFEPPEETALIAGVVEALTAARMAPTKVETGAESNGTGDSTFYVIETPNGVVLVSTLGRFATGGYGVPDAPAEVRTVLEAAGVRWIDGALGSLEVTGMPVYYFGHRDPLNVHTLLFYWQD